MVSGSLNIPIIDLENFEDPRFTDSKYVLTSPRSLEACSRLRIPPVDLLYKSRAELLERFKKLPANKIDELYIKSEEQRRDKLSKARLERRRLIRLEDSTKNGSSFADVGYVDEFTKIPQKTSIFTQPSAKNFEENVNNEPSYTKMYTDLMNKLHPNELKRIDLIQKKYQKNKTDYPTTSSSSASINSRSLQNLVLIGQASRPQSATCKRFQQSHSSTSQAQNSERNSTRRASYSSLDKERKFWQRKHTQEQIENDERERIQKSYEEKLNKFEKQKNEILKEKERNITAAHYERERKVRQVQERKQQLGKMLDEYRKELYKAREQSIQRAAERVSSRLSEEQQRLALERRQKQLQVEENTKERQRRESELRKAAELALQQKDEHIRRLIEEKEARIQESRNLALAAERLREEMLRVYNLDSFDKKVHKVTLINHMGLNERI
uniref:Uncharacterized protein n=1 Tax=Trichobilharzia regenti TaxID=157069 RepID=A0AA85IR98_TRIRE|nr:unnamed protein product [Trichobilharzia regenti]